MRNPMSLTVQAMYDSPMKPTETARLLTDGWGTFILSEFQPNDVWGIGFGYQNDHFYQPGVANMRQAGVFFSGRARKPVESLRTVPYVLLTGGFNVLSKTGNHWPGKNIYSFGLGTRLEIVRGLSADFGVHQYWLLPKPYHLQYVAVTAGLVVETGPEPFKGKRREAGIKKKKLEKKNKDVTLKEMATETSTPVSLSAAVSPVAARLTSTPTPLSQAPPTPTETLPPVKVGPPPSAPPTTASAVVRMRYFYDHGIAAYKAKNYGTAIKYLKTALTVKDPKVEQYYYAESNAMLGVIYQHYVRTPGHLDLARFYYKQALAVDPTTETAKKNLKLLGPAKPKPKPAAP